MEIDRMSKRKAPDGTSNSITGPLKKLRTKRGLSQKRLAELLSEQGHHVSADMIHRIETGKRYVYDYELPVFLNFFGEDLIREL